MFSFRSRFSDIRNRFRIDNFTPTFYADNFFEINFRRLKEIGIECICVDLDNSLLGHWDRELDRKTCDFIAWLKKEFGIQVIIIANTVFEERSARLRAIAKSAGVLGIALEKKHERKPHPTGIFEAIRLTGISRDKIAVVGDDPGWDIYSAKRAGVRVSILVRSIGKNPWWYYVFFSRHHALRILVRWKMEKRSRLAKAPTTQ